MDERKLKHSGAVETNLYHQNVALAARVLGDRIVLAAFVVAVAIAAADLI